MTTTTLSNGIVLAPQQNLTNYAHERGLHDVRAFLATHPDGKQTYLVVVGERAEFESTSYEAIAAHLDIMAMSQQWE